MEKKLYQLAEELKVDKQKLIKIAQSIGIENVSGFTFLKSAEIKKIKLVFQKKNDNVASAGIKKPTLRKKNKKVEVKATPVKKETTQEKELPQNKEIAQEKENQIPAQEEKVEGQNDVKTDNQNNDLHSIITESKNDKSTDSKDKIQSLPSNLSEKSSILDNVKNDVTRTSNNIIDDQISNKPKKINKPKKSLILEDEEVDDIIEENRIENVMENTVPIEKKEEQKDKKEEQKDKNTEEIKIEKEEGKVAQNTIPNKKKIFLGHKNSYNSKKHDAKNKKEKHQFNARKKAIRIGNQISITELASTIGIKIHTLKSVLKKLDIHVENTQSVIDGEIAQLVAAEFQIEVELSFKDIEEELKQSSLSNQVLAKRPPIVTVMGHVDHGKTTLLDYIRSTDIVSGEKGGITQHIGAYFVKTKFGQICFLDTPGHAAFTAMRSRGAVVTDIVILMVSADDGPMPQTIEAINHARAGNVPIIVAINKIDKPEANVEKTKQILTEHGITAEDYGGNDIVIGVSAKSGKGVDELLEMVVLQTDIMELKAQEKNLAKGTIVDAQIDKNRGILVAMIVQDGTLKKGDFFVSGFTYGRVRSIMNDKGAQLKTALPSTPVEILGFNELPIAGDTFQVTKNEKLAKQIVETRIEEEKIKKQEQPVNLESFFGALTEEVKTLNLIIKSDVHGSQEALSDALLRQNKSDKVKVKIIHSAVGAINTSDVTLALASQAIIIGFNVRADNNATKIAEKENAEIRIYGIIYEIIDDIKMAMEGLLDPVFHEELHGKIQVKEVFTIPKIGVVAGCYVESGKAIKDALVRVIRDNVVIHDGVLTSLRRFKDNAKEVKFGNECGISLKNFKDFRIGDVMEIYTKTEQTAVL